MERREFLKAVGFGLTIIVPQFGPLYRQGRGLQDISTVRPVPTKRIVLATGRDYEQALMKYAQQLERFYAGFGSGTRSQLALLRSAPTPPQFARTDQRGVYKLVAVPTPAEVADILQKRGT